MRLVRDTRGAVFVEFLIAFLPLFVFFMCIVELAFLHVANLVTKHSAYVAARSAAVILPDDPSYYGDPVGSPSGQRLSDIESAAKIPLSAVSSSAPEAKVTFVGREGSTFAEHDMVRVRVTYEYPCGVPIANRILCNPFSRKKTFVQEAAMPNQGSRNEYDQ
jgi:hypothetical protein